MPEIIGTGKEKEQKDQQKLIEELYQQIGQLKVENDWFSRYVLSWKLSNTLAAEFCVEALNEALEKPQPEIFNTDQGSQSTSCDFL